MLIINALEWSVLILVTLIALFLQIISDRRTNIGLLAALYLGVFFFVALEWQLAVALTVLFSGWIAGAVLAVSITNDNMRDFQEGQFSDNHLINPGFGILASIIIMILIYSILQKSLKLFVGLDIFQIWTSLILISLGLLRVITIKDPILFTVGLLSIFSGFEILITGLSSSTFIAGFLGLITLFIALTGSYLFIAPAKDT